MCVCVCAFFTGAHGTVRMSCVLLGHGATLAVYEGL